METATNASACDSSSVFIFSSLCILLFVIVNFMPVSLLAPFNTATATLAGLCISLLGTPAHVYGDILEVSGFRVRIVTECTSLYASILYGSFVFSYPAFFVVKASGAFSGIILLSFLNVVRIAAVTLVGARRPALFEVLHVYLGQVVMLLVVIALSLAWLYREDRENPLQLTVKAALWASLLFFPWLMVNKLYVAFIDGMVIRLHALFYPGYLLNTPRPFSIYNHTFAIPLFLSLIAASSNLTLRRRLVCSLAGVFGIMCWHGLFRVTHVVWTAHDVPGIEPFHEVIYLVGQYLLPFFLWLRFASPASSKVLSPAKSSIS